ncbi:MAG: tRNA-dihydrouridine synthase family protein [Brumimicrobium sp.]|nr:tRNA-dihydrouridine synthase family protein [Brumimicrobium sp.]
MSHVLISSPLQSFTEHRFRNTFDKYFGGIDVFYAPYIRLNGKREIKNNYERDLLPKNNTVENLIPQVMTNDAEEFLFVADYVQNLGYNELNWNLGCPYPMVTKKCMGSGLISEVDRVDRILDEVHKESTITVSMKMRLGYERPDEILSLLPVLDKYPIKSIGVHARLGKQLYKGGVDLDSFENCLGRTRHTIYYNGDINSVDQFRRLVSRFPDINHWMIGRWLIADPFLPTMIKNDENIYPENRLEIFGKFHDVLYHDYASALSGSSHVLVKMKSFWEYFATSFSDSHRTFKLIKKARTFEAYHDAVAYILDNERKFQKDEYY